MRSELKYIRAWVFLSRIFCLFVQILYVREDYCPKMEFRTSARTHAFFGSRLPILSSPDEVRIAQFFILQTTALMRFFSSYQEPTYKLAIAGG